ncbi:pyruvate kinase alpha/beta domain-containing protein [Clostridium tertium]|uniref:pyruvate kinase alpha/beta domain-containing protein n=1 Tax=Clostridium tertium TaxID=1559 RepID=UPI0024B3428E|nr:pyruvate kinase alpha/beta domain-containing protein [Clostridium tertium]MDI9216422.1 hypothetical protein [Clostridium tertium]
MSCTSVFIETIYFKKGGKHNTSQLLLKVYDYIRNNEYEFNYVIVSSTTGYTALEALKIFKVPNVQLIVCKQDLNEKLSLKKEVLDKLEGKMLIYDIPKKYLLNLSGNETVQILRNFSQGTKVCVELLMFLIKESIIKKGDKVIVIGGTLEGADTAISFEVNSEDKFKVINMIGLPEK